jgi:hypothetical protein
MQFSFLLDGEFIIEWGFFLNYAIGFSFFLSCFWVGRWKNPDRPLCFDPPLDVRCASKETKMKQKQKRKWVGVINEVYIYPEGIYHVD